MHAFNNFDYISPPLLPPNSSQIYSSLSPPLLTSYPHFLKITIKSSLYKWVAGSIGARQTYQGHTFKES